MRTCSVQPERVAPFVLCVLGILLLAACSKSGGRHVQAGDLNVTASVAPDPPSTGQNALHLTVKDEAGHPVNGASIDFTYDMPAMGSMPEMKGGGSVKANGGGRYTITYPLPMNGDWTLTSRITAPGHPASTLRLKVRPPHAGFTVERSDGETGPMTHASADTSGKVLEIPPRRQQLIGVTFGTVKTRPLTLMVRAPGRIRVDERRRSVVTLKYDAYVEHLYVSETGVRVTKGQRLLSLYSPALLAAERDLLLAKRNATTPSGKAVLAAAEERLKLWDLTPAQIARIERRGRAEPRITVLAPSSGTVLEKNVVEGAKVDAGTPLYRIADLSHLWVTADLYEADASLAEVGRPATVTSPMGTLHGKIDFVAPTLDPKTRTLRARLEIANPDGALKAGMYVDVSLEVPLGQKLSVPDRAVLHSGEHTYVFVDEGKGSLRPVAVTLGDRAGDFDEVKSGLSDGDRVATNATFLLSSEAHLQNALPRWSTP